MNYIYSDLNQFTYQELNNNKKFYTIMFLGVGGFGSVYKGWITPNESSSSRSRMEIPIAVKTLDANGLQGHTL
jgi:hypothetical protein